MPPQIERKLAFQPHALNDLTRAFDTAWQELRAQGVELNTEEQLKRIRTKLAQRIMEYHGRRRRRGAPERIWVARVTSSMRSWSSAAEAPYTTWPPCLSAAQICHQVIITSDVGAASLPVPAPQPGNRTKRATRCIGEIGVSARPPYCKPAVPYRPRDLVPE